MADRGVKWSGMNGIKTNLKYGPDRVARRLSKATEYYSLIGERNAKRSAKWADVTSAARSGLTGTSKSTIGKLGGTFEIEVFHRVPYGIFLETRNFSRKGKLAVIKPTIEKVGPMYFKAASKVVDNMFSDQG